MTAIGGPDGEGEENSLSGSMQEERMQLNFQDPTPDGTGFVDTSIMTQAQKANLYQANQSPRNKDNKFVRSLAQSEDKRSHTVGIKGALAGKKGDGKKNTTSFVGQFGNLGKQTLASSVKTRTILKNNFG